MHEGPATGRSAFHLTLALGCLALGFILLSGIPSIGEGAGYDRIGPRFFPYAIATGLLFLGGSFALIAVRTWRARGGSPRSTSVEGRLNRLSLALLTLALVAPLVLFERAGFVMASSVQFWLVARAFHSRRAIRDAVIAVLISVTVYAGFTYGLGASLPAGLLQGLF